MGKEGTGKKKSGNSNRGRETKELVALEAEANGS